MPRLYIPGISSRRSKRPRAKRRSRARPVEGFSIKDIERLTRVSKRCLLNWVKLGLVAKPAFRGANTRYTRSQIASILVVKKLRGDFMSTARIREKLLSMTPAEIETVADLPTVLGEPPAPVATPAQPTAPPADAGVPSEGASPHVPTYPAAKFERVTLMPGLELIVGDEPVLRRVAQLIFDQFALRATI